MSVQLTLEFVTVKILFLKLAAKQCQALCQIQIVLTPRNSPVRQVLLFHFTGKQLKPKEMKSFPQSGMAGNWWGSASDVLLSFGIHLQGWWRSGDQFFQVEEWYLKVVTPHCLNYLSQLTLIGRNSKQDFLMNRSCMLIKSMLSFHHIVCPLGVGTIATQLFHSHYSWCGALRLMADFMKCSFFYG